MKAATTIFCTLTLFFLMSFFNSTATLMVNKNQPSWYFLDARHDYKKLDHIVGIALGIRTFISDLDYITFLQYYGNRQSSVNGYKDLYSYADEITNIDPNFTFVYTYGSAILAWNLNRVEEATKLIQKGITYNPFFWQLRLYMGAIIFKQKGDTLGYIKLLEDALKYEDHPAMLERILGNIYELNKSPDYAAEYWAGIYTKSKHKDSRAHAYDRLLVLLQEKKLTAPDKIIELLK